MLVRLKKLLVQDNVFVNVVASIQYRALAEKANDAFYKLSNPRTQIQAYVFDGLTNSYLIALISFFNLLPNGNLDFLLYLFFFFSYSVVIRASVPKLDLDDAFEQKNDIAKAVEDELEKVIQTINFFILQTACEPVQS